MKDPRSDTLLGPAPKRIAHWEHWSNPDAETWLINVPPEAVKRYLDLSQELAYR